MNGWESKHRIFNKYFWAQIRHSLPKFLYKGLACGIYFISFPSPTPVVTLFPLFSLYRSPLSLWPRRDGKMAGPLTICLFVFLSISILLSRGYNLTFPPSPAPSASSNDDISGLRYNFYSETCPQTESIVRITMARFYSKQSNISAAILRLFFHDCFIQVIRTSLLLLFDSFLFLA